MAKKQIHLGVGAKVLLPAAGLMLGLAFLQPTPGRHSWFHELSGDWNVRIGNTGYEVGNMPGSWERYVIFRCVRVSPPGGPSCDQINQELDDVAQYAYDDVWILAQLKPGWGWINTQTGEVFESRKRDLLETDAPPGVVHLLGSLQKPDKSERNAFLCLAVCILFVATFLELARLLRRPKKAIYPPRCRKCGYVLLGLSTYRCPECGTPFGDMGEPRQEADAAQPH